MRCLLISSSQVYEQIKRISGPGTLLNQWLRVPTEPPESPPRWEPWGEGDRACWGQREHSRVHVQQRAAYFVHICKSKMKKNWNLEACVTQPWTTSDVPSPCSEGTLRLPFGERAPPPWDLSGAHAPPSSLCRDVVKS